MPASPLFDILSCVHCKLHVISLYRIKVNCEKRHSKRYYSNFHYDYNSFKGTHENPIGHDHMKTGILYLNTNDGYTEFETGEIVESVANRVVIFEGNQNHRGTTCTNQKTRIVLNINYI